MLENNLFYKAVNAENLQPQLGRPNEAIFMPLVNPEEKATIANKMEALLEKLLKNNESPDKDKYLYALVLAANLTLYFNEYLDSDKSIIYWEEMEKYYTSLLELESLEDNANDNISFFSKPRIFSSAEWGAVIAGVYKTIAHYPFAIAYYKLAISFAQANANKENKFIKSEGDDSTLQTYWLGLAETYLAYGNKAHKQSSQYPIVFVEEKYLEAIKSTQQGIQLSQVKMPYTTKLYYYQAQATYLLAALYYKEFPYAAGYLFLQAMLADIQGLKLTKTNKEKLLQHLRTCHKAFSSVVAQLPQDESYICALASLKEATLNLSPDSTTFDELITQVENLSLPLKNVEQLQAYLEISSQNVSAPLPKP